MDQMDPLLDPEAAAKVLNVSLSWLAKARVGGDGPEFVKIGRAVRYPESSLRKFNGRGHERLRARNEHLSQYIAIHHRDLEFR